MNSNEISSLLTKHNVCNRCQKILFGHEFRDFTIVSKQEEGIELKNNGLQCCMCLGILEDHIIHVVAKELCEKFKPHEITSFQLKSIVPSCIASRRKSLVTFCKKKSPMIREFGDVISIVSHISKMFIGNLVANLTGKVFKKDGISTITVTFSDPLCDNVKNGLPTAIKEPIEFKTKVQARTKFQNSLIIAGRYKKYSRNVSTFPMSGETFLYKNIQVQRGIQISKTAVSVLIKRKLLKFRSNVKDEIEFHTCGKEDVDVQMLGTGRPFCVTIKSPTVTTLTKTELESLESDLNSSTDLISVHDLIVTDLSVLRSFHERIKKMKEVVQAKLWCPVPISDNCMELFNKMKNIKFTQKIPIQVLSMPQQFNRNLRRETNKTGHVEYVTLKRTVDADVFELEMSTNAPKFIKEFIHGDFGRTEPSIKSLLKLPIELIELNVISVEMKNWPPKIQ